MKIDGREIASKILVELKKRVEKLKEKNLPAGKQGIIPHLSIILIDKDPASVVYVNQKEIKGKKIGAKILVKNLPPDVSEEKLLITIKQFNNNNKVHGIIAQRPLPPQIDSNKISSAIDPKKDVDGFHPNSKFQPPIALAVLRVLKEIYLRDETPRMVERTKELACLTGVGRQRPRLLRGGFREWLISQNIVVIGKGTTGGTPIFTVLKKMGINPDVIDSKTKNPQNLTKKADIIISAVGKANVIKPEMLKKGVILIGVGLYKRNDGKIHGDYAEEKIKNIASFYTPTPGGVGPVNVAMLLESLVTAAENFYLSKSTKV